MKRLELRFNDAASKALKKNTVLVFALRESHSVTAQFQAQSAVGLAELAWEYMTSDRDISESARSIVAAFREWEEADACAEKSGCKDARRLVDQAHDYINGMRIKLDQEAMFRVMQAAIGATDDDMDKACRVAADIGSRLSEQEINEVRRRLDEWAAGEGK